MRRVLLVEDEPWLNRAIVEECARLGAQPVEADDEFEAMKRVADGPYDVVVLDLMIASHRHLDQRWSGGLRVLEAIRQTEWGASVRVLALSTVAKDDLPQLDAIHILKGDPKQPNRILHELRRLLG